MSMLKGLLKPKASGSGSSSSSSSPSAGGMASNGAIGLAGGSGGGGGRYEMHAGGHMGIAGGYGGAGGVEATPRADVALPHAGHRRERRRSSIIRETVGSSMKELPLLKDTPVAKREALFKQKLGLCSVSCRQPMGGGSDGGNLLHAAARRWSSTGTTPSRTSAGRS